MRCSHVIRRPFGRLDCRGELELVDSIAVVPRSAAVIHSRDDEAPEPRAQTWEVYRCARNHETRILTDGPDS